MHSGGILLIVEDDLIDQQMIEAALRSANSSWRIILLRDGAEAIAYLRGDLPFADRTRHPYPAFIITDLKMPRADGLAVLEFLKSTPRSAIIPTVVFSSSADPDDIEKAYSLGASSYHVKPMTAEAFKAQLKLLLDYWTTCEVPVVDASGVRRITESRGRIGERYSSDPFTKPATSPGPASPA